MSNYITSISIESSDVEIVKAIKADCRNRGISFSFIVAQQLKKYYEEVLANGHN